MRSEDFPALDPEEFRFLVRDAVCIYYNLNLGFLRSVACVISR
jgi:hypothetical protein